MSCSIVACPHSKQVGAGWLIRGIPGPRVTTCRQFPSEGLYAGSINAKDRNDHFRFSGQIKWNRGRRIEGIWIIGVEGVIF